MKILLDKSTVLSLVADKAPEYVELFKEFQSYDGGWLIWPDFLIKVKNKLNLDNYVLLYEDQKKIDVCLFLFLMGEEGWKEWNAELNQLTHEEQITTLKAFTQDLIDDDGQWLDEMLGEIPQAPEDEIKAKEQFEAMSKEAQTDVTKRATFLFFHILSAIHNYFAVMVTGE